jgi:hypothetical protein
LRARRQPSRFDDADLTIRQFHRIGLGRRRASRAA